MYGQNKKYLVTWVDKRKNEHCKYCSSRDQVNYVISIHKLTNDTCTVLYQTYYPNTDKTKFEIKNKDFFVDNFIKDRLHVHLETEGNYKAGPFYFRLRSVEGLTPDKYPIAVLYHGEEFLVGGTRELDELIIKLNLPLRICTKCGLPMTKGWVVNSNEYYHDEREFNERMDDIYGHHNWKKSESKATTYQYMYKEEGGTEWFPEDSRIKDWEEQ